MMVSPKKVLFFLSSLAGAFFVIFIITTFGYENFDMALAGDPLELFNLNAEISIPTWYAQSLLLLAAGLLFLIAKGVKQDKKYWYILSGVLVFLSVDEGASIHELFTVPLRELLNISEGFLYYTWVLAYGGAVLLGGVFFIRFFVRLPQRTRKLVAISFIVFLSGALGMEMIGALIISQTDVSWVLYVLAVGIEELFEMLGVVLLIYTLLDYTARYGRQVFQLRFGA